MPWMRRLETNFHLPQYFVKDREQPGFQGQVSSDWVCKEARARLLCLFCLSGSCRQVGLHIQVGDGDGDGDHVVDANGDCTSIGCGDGWQAGLHTKLKANLKWANGILKRPLFYAQVQLSSQQGPWWTRRWTSSCCRLPCRWLLIICTIPVWYRSVLLWNCSSVSGQVPTWQKYLELRATGSLDSGTTHPIWRRWLMRIKLWMSLALSSSAVTCATTTGTQLCTWRLLTLIHKWVLGHHGDSPWSSPSPGSSWGKWPWSPWTRPP